MSFKSKTTGKKVTAPQEITGHRSEESIRKQRETVALNKAIKSAIYDELKKQLLSTDKAKAYYQTFIKNYLAKAKADPDSRAAQTVASTIFQQEILTLLDEQHEKEVANDREFTRYKLLKTFFKEQREVIYEVNQAKHIIACCSRRAGKTDLSSGAICYAALVPDSRIIYINLTFTNAVTQIFENVVSRSEMCGLTITSSSKASGTIEWNNGSSLRIVGNSNNSEIDKLRGEKKVSLVVIDEFFHQRNLEYGINEVIGPLLIDRADSCLLGLGTPPRIPKTYGEKVWYEPNWKKFHWTARDNPYIPNFEEYIDEICNSKGISRDAPFIQREYYGIMGVYDKEAMVFKDYKTYENEVPADFKPTHIAIGMDVGFEDYNAIVALAYNVASGLCYVIDERKFNRASISEIIKQVQEVYSNSKKFLIERNKTAELSNIDIYCDMNNKELVYELHSVQHLPAFCCYKYEKNLAISQLAEWCRTGKIFIPKGNFLEDEFERTLYKRDEEDNILPEIDDELFHPDAAMALLYASRQMWFDTGNDLGGQSKEDWSTT